MWRNTKRKTNDARAHLAVKNRPRPPMDSRLRAVLLALSVCLLATVSGYLTYRSWDWLRERVLYQNPLFAIDTIEVSPEYWVTAEQVRAWSGVRLGDNLLRVDVSRVRRDLELKPQIESASVERVLPSLLRLRVKEREPVARLQGVQRGSSGELTPTIMYLDTNAVVIPPLSVSNAPPEAVQALAALPLIRGVPGSELRPGQALTSFGARTALRLLAGIDRSPMAGKVDVLTLDVSGPEVIAVTCAQGSEITLGLDDLPGQLRRWRTVTDAGARLGKTIAALDLSLANNNPLLWQDTNAAPAVRPPPRPTRPRKSHV